MCYVCVSMDGKHWLVDGLLSTGHLSKIGTLLMPCKYYILPSLTLQSLWLFWPYKVSFAICSIFFSVT